MRSSVQWKLLSFPGSDPRRHLVPGDPGAAMTSHQLICTHMEYQFVPRTLEALGL